jgi:hypothetical protein
MARGEANRGVRSEEPERLSVIGGPASADGLLVSNCPEGVSVIV